MSKDWVGGSASVFKALGATNHAEGDRADKDFYATDPLAIDALKKKVDLPRVILEPACGQGHLSERLKQLGHEVFSFDIVDRGYGKVQNFFELLALPDSLSLSAKWAIREICNSYKSTIQHCSAFHFARFGVMP